MFKKTLLAALIVAGLTTSGAAFADQYNNRSNWDRAQVNDAQMSDRAEPNPANANGTLDRGRYRSHADERAKNNRTGCGQGTWRFCPNNEFHYNSGDTSTDTHISTR